MSIDCVPHQDLRRLGRAEASAELYHWGGQLAQLLVICSLERRNQLEVHVCGGTTQVLRELRKLVSVPAAAGAAAAAAAAGVKWSPTKLSKWSSSLSGGFISDVRSNCRDLPERYFTRDP